MPGSRRAETEHGALAHWGYPLAIVLMICAPVPPYLFFRGKKWL